MPSTRLFSWSLLALILSCRLTCNGADDGDPEERYMIVIVDDVLTPDECQDCSLMADGVELFSLPQHRQISGFYNFSGAALELEENKEILMELYCDLVLILEETCMVPLGMPHSMLTAALVLDNIPRPEVVVSNHTWLDDRRRTQVTKGLGDPRKKRQMEDDCDKDEKKKKADLEKEAKKLEQEVKKLVEQAQHHEEEAKKYKKKADEKDEKAKGIADVAKNMDTPSAWECFVPFWNFYAAGKAWAVVDVYDQAAGARAESDGYRMLENLHNNMANVYWDMAIKKWREAHKKKREAEEMCK